MSSEDWIDNARRWFTDQPNSRLIGAGLIIFGVGYLIFGMGKNGDYHKQVNEEVKLAQLLCENSHDWVLADLKRLKLGQANLKDLKINGQTVELEYVRYPEVVFLDSGISKIGARGSTASDLYCYVQDPRSSGARRYYNYETRQWVDRVRFHR